MKKYNQIYKLFSDRFSRAVSVTVAIFMSFGFSLAMFAPKVGATGDGTITLSPTSGTYAVGTDITMTISENSSAGDDVNAVQINLSYPTAELTYVSSTLESPFSDLEAQDTGGSGAVAIAGASDAVVSGTQTVAQVVFEATGAGTAAVDVTNGSGVTTTAIDSDSGTNVWNGTLATTSFTVSSTPPTVTISDITADQYVHSNPVDVDATSSDNAGGTITNAKFYFDSTLLNTITTAPFDFTLNTLTYADGSYTLEVTSTDSNSLTGNSTYTVIVNNGDLNGDGSVGISDLAIMAAHWGTASGATYAEGSITGNGEVNVSDLAIMAANWDWAS